MKKMRWTIRILFLVASVALVVCAKESRFHAVLPACSPFVALISIAAGGASLILLPAACVLLISVFYPRFFCCWVCPAGSCFELAGAKFPKRRWISGFPRMGTWFLFLGVGAALAGFPLFVVLDPLALFASAFGWLRPELTGWEVAGVCIFPLMVSLSAVAPWLWCGRLCPLGALQDVSSLPFKLWQRRKIPERKRVGSTELQPKMVRDTGRRIFLGLGIGAAYRLLLNPAKLQAKTTAIRPPACGNEARFFRLCSRCGACARACPDQIIKQGGVDSGFAGVLAPELDFSRAGCPPECIRCGEACPTGAIPNFTENDKFKYPLGVIVLKMNLCLLTHSKECGVCMNACPHQAITITWNPVEMESTLIVDKKLCTGCGICQYVCPVQPAAILVKAAGA